MVSSGNHGIKCSLLDICEMDENVLTETESCICRSWSSSPWSPEVMAATLECLPGLWPPPSSTISLSKLLEKLVDILLQMLVRIRELQDRLYAPPENTILKETSLSLTGSLHCLVSTCDTWHGAVCWNSVSSSRRVWPVSMLMLLLGNQSTNFNW